MVTKAKVEAFSVAQAAAKVDELYKAFGENIDIDVTILATDSDSKPLGYSFNWLKNNQEEANMQTGAIKFEDFKGLTSMPQKAATAWAAATEGLLGVGYVPLVFVGTQPVRGVNYWFIALKTLVTAEPKKEIVKMAINEFQGEYAIVENKTEVIFE